MTSYITCYGSSEAVKDHSHLMRSTAKRIEPIKNIEEIEKYMLNHFKVWLHRRDYKVTNYYST